VTSPNGPLERISALTLKTADMDRSVGFYEDLGFGRLYGGRGSEFTSFAVGDGYLNIQLDRDYRPGPVWGRAIFFVDDVDAMYRRAVAAGHRPETAPADAPWGERYFQVRDPDGHELSFAHPLAP
jgi:catechol 2,3-dioxygenase-like lactoylglutathione lyase family enzyme